MNNTFTRGQGILVTATFTDPSGQPIVPNSANLYLSFLLPDGTYTEVTQAMIQSSTPNIWTSIWDSSVAEPGHVYGHCRSVPVPAAADDFAFKLEANSANPEPP